MLDEADLADGKGALEIVYQIVERLRIAAGDEVSQLQQAIAGIEAAEIQRREVRQQARIDLLEERFLLRVIVQREIQIQVVRQGLTRQQQANRHVAQDDEHAHDGRPALIRPYA